MEGPWAVEMGPGRDTVRCKRAMGKAGEASPRWWPSAAYVVYEDGMGADDSGWIWDNGGQPTAIFDVDWWYGDGVVCCTGIGEYDGCW